MGAGLAEWLARIGAMQSPKVSRAIDGAIDPIVTAVVT